MIVNYELDTMWRQTVLAHLKVVFMEMGKPE
jgi:hypothetical protein